MTSTTISLIQRCIREHWTHGQWLEYKRTLLHETEHYQRCTESTKTWVQGQMLGAIHEVACRHLMEWRLQTKDGVWHKSPLPGDVSYQDVTHGAFFWKGSDDMWDEATKMFGKDGPA